ncbi:purine-cytosine permease family protein [Wenjunlia tyrosinilytica]|uniref:Cytosine permease n=1 Tax=Wenjunlia tyrosinilytica TaxID=1544741 RepID=A0A918DX62_9ACTN|nr:cytosine permease [Wenjunlia tyrosinilytica]GGO86474.1 cytosine permease [Wenjunlia tyrosinilytica]
MTAPPSLDAPKIGAADPRHPEAPLVLDTEPPRPLGFRDQAAFWANLGVSLLGFSGAAWVLTPSGHPQLSLLAAITATVVGTVVGTAMVAVSGILGTRTGAPAMAILRGLFGTKLSYLPTVLNIIQCVGWGVFELTVITLGVEAMTDGKGPHWLYVLLAGALTTALTIKPLGSVRLLRRYVTIAVGVSMLYFTVQLLRQDTPSLNEGSWSGFLPAVDSALAVAVSFVPLAADYTRHSRSTAKSFWGTLVGYSTAQIWCYLLGLLALLQVGGDADKIFDTFLGVGAGWVFFAVLVVREVDQSFANVYSTAMSVHNLLPKVDRRVLCLGIGTLVTVLAMMVDDFSTYESFLYLIGSVFVPMFAVTAVDFFLGSGRRGWDMSQDAPVRWVMLVPWALGFSAYQLINPTQLTGWADFWPRFWADAQNATGIHATVWTSASLFSFFTAGSATLALAVIGRQRAVAR